MNGRRLMQLSLVCLAACGVIAALWAQGLPD